MKFIELLNVFLIYEKVDFDSKPEFAIGTEFRTKIDEILKYIKESKFSFKDLDIRYANGFIAERVKAFIANKFDSKEIADTLVKFAYLIKFHSKDLISKNYSLDLRKYPYPKLKEMVNKEYDIYIKADAEKKESKEKAVKGSELVFEGDKYKIFKITTKEASIEMGRNTNWCISADDSKDKDVSNYWDDYTEYTHYFLIRKEKSQKDEKYNKIVVSILKSTSTFYDLDGFYENENNLADDEEIDTSELLFYLKEEDKKTCDWLYNAFKDDTIMLQKQIIDAINNKVTFEELLPFLNDNKLNFDIIFVYACIKNNLKLVQYLLKNKNIHINFQDQYGDTGFILACANNSLEVVQELLKDGRVDINIKNNYGNTGFILACANNYLEVVRELLKDSRLDINKKDNYGYTGFIKACRGNALDVVKVLLKDKRIDINETTNTNYVTAFIAACINSFKEIVELLLQDPRLDINIKDKRGKTGYDLANQPIKELIDEYKNKKKE